MLLFFSSSNMGEFSKDLRMLAALEEADNDGDKLMEAARRLAGAFSELLTVAQPGANEVAFIHGSSHNLLCSYLVSVLSNIFHCKLTVFRSTSSCFRI